MKIAHITSPRDTLCVPGSQKYHLALAQWCLSYPEYLDFHAQRSLEGDFVILDNGAYESECLLPAQLISLANRILPDVVVLPDNLDDNARQSLHRMEFGLTAMRSQPWDFMAVPHAKSLDDYIELCEILPTAFEGWGAHVGWLGIYRNITADFHISREAVVARLAHLPFQFHLLGAADPIKDISSSLLCHRCAGIDTTKFYRSALEDGPPGIPSEPRQPDFTSWRTGGEQAQHVRLALSKLLQAAPTDDPFLSFILDAHMTHSRKVSDYSEGPVRYQPMRESEAIGVPAWKSSMTRLLEKTSRITSLMKDDRTPNFESINDSLRDIAVLAGITSALYGEYAAEEP